MWDYYLSRILSLPGHVGYQHLPLFSHGVTALRRDKRDKRNMRDDALLG